ncbi:MAG: hypothetical protein NXI24_07705 [bacterium]|nr:hypothetical protein [bacterium]
MSDAERIVAKATIAIDGVAGIEVLAVGSPAGDVSLLCDGRPLADSTQDDDTNLLNLRTARGAAFEKLGGLLDELEAAIADQSGERKSATSSAIEALRILLKQA